MTDPTIAEQITRLFKLMDAADDALDKDTYEQKRRDDFDAPDDAEWSVQAGTCRKITAVFMTVERLRRANLLATLQQHEARLAMRRDAVMRGLYCADDCDLDQSSVGRSFDAILKQVRDGAPHDGDCTNQAHTCFVCLIAELEKRADAFIAGYDAALDVAETPEGV